MSKEKQIKEIACDMCTVIQNCNEPYKPIPSCRAYQCAKRAVEKGYRKQSEGEWKQMEFWEGGGTWRCTECGKQVMFLKETPKTQNLNFCPNCGAKMKGGAE